MPIDRIPPKNPANAGFFYLCAGVVSMSSQLDGAMQQNNGAIETFTYAMSIVSDRNIKDDVTYVSGEDALAAIKVLISPVKQLKSAQK